MKPRALHRVATVAVLITLLASACSAADDPSDGSEAADGDGTAELEVALLVPLTGPASGIGASFAATVEHLADEVNEAGGVDIAGTTHTIRLTRFDDENTAEGGQVAAREAIEDGYEFIMGPFGSAPTSAITSQIQQAGVFWLVNATVAGPTANPLAFRPTPLAGDIEQEFLRLLESRPELQRIAMTTDRQFTGAVERTADFSAEIEELAEIVASEEHQAGDTDMRPVITRMAAQDPDVYLLRGYPGEMPTFVEQVRELAGPDPLIVTQNVLMNEDTRAVFPDLTVLDNTLIASVPSSLEQFVAAEDARAVALSEALGDEQGTFSAWAHDSFRVFVTALEAAASLEVDAVAEAMAALTVDDVQELTFNTFEPRDGGTLFGADREIQMRGAMMAWDPDDGWIFLP